MLNSIKQLFKLLNQHMVDYCLLRKNGDIDILTSKKDFKKTRRLLKKLNFRQTFKGPFPGHAVFIKFIRKETRFLVIDLHVGGLTRDGILYLPAEPILKRKLKKSDYFVPGKKDLQESLALHRIIDKKSLHPEKKLAILISSIIKDPPSIFRYISIQAKRVFKVLNPFYFGPLVVLIGPDAAGKSSIAKRVAEVLGTGGLIARTVYFGWRGSVIPGTYQAMKLDEKLAKKVDFNPTINKVRSAVITISFFIERYIRYITQILPPRLLGYTVLTDRYFYDRFILDVSIGERVKKLLVGIAPKPTLIIYLEAKENTLKKRDPSMPKESLAIQRKLFRKYKGLVGATEINTEKLSINQSVSFIIERLVVKRRAFPNISRP